MLKRYLPILAWLPHYHRRLLGADLMAGLIDEMQLTISPVALGRGEHLLQGIDLTALGFRLAEHVTTPNAMHLVFTRR